MEILTSSFLGAFLLIYSVLHPFFLNPIFATYVVILILIIATWYKLYHYLKNQSLTKATTQKKLRIGFLWTFEVYLTLMIFWYIFDHFKTYSIM